MYDARTSPHGRWSSQYPTGAQSGYRSYGSRTLAPNAERQIYVDPQFPGAGGPPLGLQLVGIDHASGACVITGDRTPAATAQAM